MDQDLAKSLFYQGATLVLLNVPERTEFGIDYNSWTVGPKFKGVKMIPPGFHFVYYSAVSKEGQSAPRTGFFHFFRRREVLVKQWDPAVEDLTDDADDSAERIRGNLEECDPFLGPYPYEHLSKWVSLTNHITEDLVSRIQPLSGRVSAVTQLQSEAYARPHTSTSGLQSAASGTGGVSGGVSDREEGEGRQEDEEDQSEQKEAAGMFAGPKPVAAPAQMKDLNMKYAKDAMLRLSTIPAQKYPEGATPSQISHHNMDLSFCLETMLSNEYNNTMLHFQLKEIQEDFFVDIVSRNNFLTATLQTFFSSLEQADGSVDRDLVKRGLQFRGNLTKKYNWDFSSEPEDFAPTVVENT